VSPGRIIGDGAIVAAALEMPDTRSDLLALRGFHGRGAQRYADRWLAALQTARELPDDQLPARAPRSDGPPAPRSWAERDPIAAERLVAARDAVVRISEEHQVPAENLIAPDIVRRLMWQPPAADRQAVSARLRQYGAREWQVGLIAADMTAAIAAHPAD
jgi:ribonuclease D